MGTAPGQIDLAIGDRRLWLTGQGDVGEVWSIPLGQDYLLSTDPPGASTAALTLPGRVLSAVAGSGECTVEVLGQELNLPWPAHDGVHLASGDRAYLSLNKLLARPVQIDSDEG